MSSLREFMEFHEHNVLLKYSTSVHAVTSSEKKFENIKIIEMNENHFSRYKKKKKNHVEYTNLLRNRVSRNT